MNRSLDDKDNLQRLNRLMTRLFEYWNIDASEQNALIGNTTTIEDAERYLNRAAQLLHMHKCLRLLFPKNRALTYAWIRTPNRAFGELSPLHILITEHEAGFVKVVSYLDQALQS